MSGGFRMKHTSFFTWPAICGVPKSGGEYDEVKFEVEFEAVPQDEIDRVIEDLSLGGGDSVSDKNMRGLRRVVRAVRGFEFEREDGTLIEEQSEINDRAYQYPFIMQAIREAWFESQSGYERKN